VGQHIAKLGREGRADRLAVTEPGAAAKNDFQVFVFDVVQQNTVGHCLPLHSNVIDYLVGMP
jgi:hypothetical protein